MRTHLTQLKIIAFFSTLLISTLANASHFRYGHFTWVVGATPNTVEMKLQNAWRHNGYGSSCIDLTTLGATPCTGASTLPGVGDVIAEYIGFSRLDWGDSTPLVGAPGGLPLLYLVTSVDPVNNWLFGEAVDPGSLPLASSGDPIDTTLNHTYSNTGSYTAFLSSCCRIRSVSGLNVHVNNPSRAYRVETVIDVGSGNNSPVSVQTPIVICPFNAICSFAIPSSDVDGDVLSFRLATATEAGGSFIQPGFPGSGSTNPASIDPVTGIYTWDTNAATTGSPTQNTLYSTQVIIDDGSSLVALDFMILLGDVDMNPPTIDPPPGSDPICNTTQVVKSGETLTFDVIASDPDATDSVSLNIVGLPSGAAMTPTLPISGNPVSSQFQWTPTDNQIGNHVASFSAVSSSGGFSQCAVTLSVVVASSTCDIDGDGNIDKLDINRIIAARNTVANGSNDPMDADGDGYITVLDARQCAIKCDLNNCAVL